MSSTIKESTKCIAGNWSKLDDSEELRREGNELYDQGKYEEAYEIYGRALKLIPMAKRIPATFVPLEPIQAFILRCQELAAKCFNNMA
uniref:Uncharacterized protein n=1 Tax=Romanomermis culicivorax TaxID=13658 RepID=A0A915KPY4_ROMCU